MVKLRHRLVRTLIHISLLFNRNGMGFKSHATRFNFFIPRVHMIRDRKFFFLFLFLFFLLGFLVIFFVRVRFRFITSFLYFWFIYFWCLWFIHLWCLWFV